MADQAGQEEANVGTPPDDGNGRGSGGGEVAAQDKGPAARPREEKWATRNGINLESFEKRDYGLGVVELDRSMKSRHLYMVAIGVCSLCFRSILLGSGGCSTDYVFFHPKGDLLEQASSWAAVVP